jgi:hypothetical protein
MHLYASLRPAVAVALFALAGVFGLHGTAFAQEVQVPFDEEGRIDVITPVMEARLRLFPDYPTFEEARLFRMPDGSYELVIQYRQGGQSLRTRMALTSEEAADLRRRVALRLGETGILTPDFEDSRRTFLGTTTFLGGFYGITLPIMLGVASESTIASMPLLGMAAGFGIPFMMTRNTFVSPAEATMTAYGGVQGAVHGLLLGIMITNDVPSNEATAALMTLGSAGQAVAGYKLAQAGRITAGAAESMISGSLFGSGYAMGLIVLAGGEEIFDTASQVAGTFLIGSVGGSYLAHRVATRRGFTQGDSRISTLAGLLGFQVGATALLLAESEDARLSAGFLMATTTAGLYAGMRMVDGFAFTRSQANIISLGAWTGGLAGSGIAMATEASEKTAAVLGILGSAAGFGYTYMTYAEDARRTSGDRLRLGIAPIVTPRQPGLASAGYDIRPGLNVRYTFD